MQFRKFNNFTSFFVSAWDVFSKEKLLLSVFIFFSIVTALTEGVGVAMLIPILESQSSQSLFANVPLISDLSAVFAKLEPKVRLQSIAIVLSVILIGRGILLYVTGFLGQIIPLKIERDIFEKGYNALLDADYTFFAEKSIGEHVSSLRTRANRLTSLLIGLITLVNGTLLLIMYLTIMINLSWKLAISAIVFLAILTVLIKYLTAKPLQRESKVLSEKDAALDNAIHETMVGMKFIRYSAAEKIMKNRYVTLLSQRMDSRFKTSTYLPMPSPILVTLAGLFVCGLLYITSFDQENAHVLLSELLIFLFLLMRLLTPATLINYARTVIHTNYNALELLQQFFKETAEHYQLSGDKIIGPIKNGITFENVTFQYTQSDKSAIKNLSFTIPAGKMVAFVGPSGSGKSTIVSLLTRFYELQNGTIKFDGVDIKDIDVHDLRRKISVVSQDIFIFNDTVKNNLSFALDGVTDSEIKRAVELASADEFIDALPEGYDTMLGDRGLRLSGGQQQRIAIARAFLRKPDFLIMDEATSNLDTFTEKSIQAALEVLRHDRTMLVIAHRLSTIRKADIVAVLKDGQVVEVGKHSELMLAKGAYWEMVSDQNLDLL